MNEKDEEVIFLEIKTRGNDILMDASWLQAEAWVIISLFSNIYSNVFVVRWSRGGGGSHEMMI